MNVNANSMHRLVKLVLDSGEAANPEDAKIIFSRYRLRIHLGFGWENTLAGQAAALTAINTASRAFLGGVIVTGDISQNIRVPLFEGKNTAEVVNFLGGQYVATTDEKIPTIVIGAWNESITPPFCIRLSFDGWQAGCAPIGSAKVLIGEMDNPLSGVAAAALGVNEAFLHVRGDLIEAGDREVGISLWNPAAANEWAEIGSQGPVLEYLPSSLWLVGLGHLGQAYAWTIGMLPYAQGHRPYLVLQDFDAVTKSNLSTCMLVYDAHLGRRKTRIVAEVLEACGFRIDIVERRFNELQRLSPGDPTTALFGVDNVVARRSIDTSGFDLVVEAGLGSGYRDFRNIRTHVFPGSKLASDVWTASDAVQRAVELSPTYERLAETSTDRCGVTELASRAVATPFVGAMAAALALGDIVRLLHGGTAYSTIDIQLKDMRHRAVGKFQYHNTRNMSFVRVAKS